MNSRDDITPEEKLLRLIREPAKKHSKEKQIEEGVSSIQKKHIKPFVSVVESKTPKFRRQKIMFSGVTSLNFVLINRLIFTAILVAVALFLFDLYFKKPKIYKPVVLRRKQENVYLLEKKMKPFSYYKKEISKRNIFKSSSKEYRAKRVAPSGSTFKDLIKNLSLLGIVSGENRQAIIEDKKLRKTYFLYPGDSLGEIKIEEIFQDSVVLEFKGERVSLFL